MLIEGAYNYNIVFVAILVAILATFSSLHIIEKMSHETGKSKYFWLISGSFVMGTGMWAAHYIGMLSFEVPIASSHDLLLTFVSIAVSIVSFFIGFYFIMPRTVNNLQFILSVFFLGVGITSMHYIGIEAVNIQADIVHNKFYMILSLAIAFLAAIVTLKLFLIVRNQSFSIWLKALGSFIMGIAIYLSHAVSMQSITLYAHKGAITKVQELNPSMLYSIIIVISFILLNSWGAMLFDHHVLKRMAFKDPLTGLSNRNEMSEFFERFYNGELLTFIFMDLDQFKSINDQFGHDVGDNLIQEVAERLKVFITPEQHAFRIGGDEFLFIVESGDQNYIKKLANNILQSIKEVYYIDGNELSMTISMGIVIGEAKKENGSTLLKQADTAMYRSKTFGKNRYCIYDEVMDEAMYRKVELEKGIKTAVDNNEFFLVYQPKWNVKDDCLAGFEALLRWNHPQFGLVSPGEFIPIAEKTRSIIPITLWVLEEVSNQSKLWQKRGFAQPISVNFSARMFELEDLAKQVQFILQKVGLDPCLLEIEITETMILEDVERVTDQLEKIRTLGIIISMDDFGTGYSSIGMLDQIPLDTLKLDRLFINDIETTSKRTIVHAIITMANSLNLHVIAEGVEVQEHIDILTELGCYIMQGYFYSKPMRVKEVEAWVQEQRKVSCKSIEPVY